jgi:hypothetical protein
MKPFLKYGMWSAGIALSILLVACSGEESDGTSGTPSSASNGTSTSSATGSANGGSAGQGGASQGGGGGAAGQGGQSGGSFACGKMLTCQGDTEYCSVFYPGVKGGMITYACEPLPQTCQPDPNCACLGNSPGCMCDEDPAGNLTMSCFGV